MSLRILYLQNVPSFNGREGLPGQKLQEAFRARSNNWLGGYRVLPGGAAGDGQKRLNGGVLSEESVRDLSPNVIYIEGGLFAHDGGAWKIHWPLVEGLVERGGVLVVADCGTRELRRHRSSYDHAARFLRSQAEIPTGEANRGGDAACRGEDDREIVCEAEGMTVAEWLRPALSGISKIAIRNPARLESWEEIAASAPADTSRMIRSGDHGQVSREGLWIFASVAQCGFGFVVFIAGEVSADDWVERYPSNACWLTNLSELLLREGERNSAWAASPIAMPFALLLSHRSVNKQLAVRVGEALRRFGTQVWIDTEHPTPVDSLIQGASRGLEKMTHFVLFWSRACLGAPWVERELPAAVSMAVERRMPVLVVRLDMTPVPEVITDAFRIEGLGLSPQELAISLIQAVRRLRRNAG